MRPKTLIGLIPAAAALAPIVLLASSCTSSTPRPSPAARADVASRPPLAPDYLRYVAYEVPTNERVLLRWPERAMPLRVHLPRPPRGLFTDPDAVVEAVRLGVEGWTGVAAPGLPSFEFVDEPGDADIPIVWAARPTGWFIASCSYAIDTLNRRLGVDHLLVTGRWRDGQEASLPQLETAVLHEMGHALGLTGHSPSPTDVMYKYVTHESVPELSARDRNTLRALYSRPIGARLVGSRSLR
jgi:predicted Zn-dependent protease